MTRIGPLLPLMSIAMGIAISSAANLSWLCGILPIVSAIAVYYVLMTKSGNPVAAYRLNRWHNLWIVALFSGIGMIDEGLSRPRTLEDVYDGNIPVLLQCEVTGIQTATHGDRIEVMIDNTNGAYAQVRSGAVALSPGDIVTVPSSGLIRLSADTTEISRRIAPMLMAKGILYSGWISPDDMAIIGHVCSLRSFFHDIRESIEIEIERSNLRKRTADFLKAILMGDKTGLDENVRMTFVNGGTAHMLALSGLHMGIIAGLMMWLMWPVKAIGRYKWGYGAMLPILWCYVLLSGMSPSAVRACIMISFAFVAIIMERRNSIASALCSACLLILLFDPMTLFDAGFQLSVTCVASLIAFASRLNPMDRRKHPLLYGICGAILATLVATGASWALTSFYFGQIPLMFLPTNLLLIPLLPIYIAIGVVFVTFICCGLEVEWLGVILDHGYDFMIWATHTLSADEEFVVSYQIPLWALAAWIFMLCVSAWALNRQTS